MRLALVGGRVLITLRIMYLTAEGFDTPNPNNHLALSMIDDFLKQGIEVYMVSSHRKGIDRDIPDCLRNRRGFSYDIVHRPVVDKTHLVTRYLEEMAYSFKALCRWYKHRRDIDIVHLQSCPTVVFSVILAWLFIRRPVVYSVFDVFPGSAYDTGTVRSRFIYGVLQMLQKPVYWLSAKIVVVCEDMKAKVLSLGVPVRKIRVIVNWYDETSVQEVPVEENRFIQKYQIDTSRFYVQYAGTIGFVLDYEMIIKVADLLRQESDIVFQIVGDGNVKERFSEQVRDRKLSNILFYPLQPLEIVPDVYSACSMSLIPLKKGVIGNAYPSKASLLMGCGRVVVSSVEADSEYYRMLNQNEIGFAVPNDNPGRVAEVIRFLRDNPERLREMGHKAKTYGERYYSRRHNTSKFAELYRELYGKER